MRRFFEVLYNIVKSRVDAFAEDTAEALEKRDKLHLVKNLIILAVTLLAIIGVGASILGLLYLGRKFLVALISMRFGNGFADISKSEGTQRRST